MLQNFFRNSRVFQIKASSFVTGQSNNTLSSSSSLFSSSSSSSVNETPEVTEGELRIKGILEERFPNASTIVVHDISGGCGSLYSVLVKDKEFGGLSVLRQHKLIYQTLKQEIKKMHGIQIETKPD